MFVLCRKLGGRVSVHDLLVQLVIGLSFGGGG